MSSLATNHEPLDTLLEAPSSPHFPLGRARTERDHFAERLAKRLPRLRRRIEAVRFDRCPLNELAILGRVRRLREPREVRTFRRLLELSRLVAALEAKSLK